MLDFGESKVKIQCLYITYAAQVINAKNYIKQTGYTKKCLFLLSLTDAHMSHYYTTLKLILPNICLLLLLLF